MFVAPAFPLNTAGSFRLFPALCSESGRSAALNLRQARLLRRTKEHIARFRKKQRTCGFHCIRVRVSDLLCKKAGAAVCCSGSWSIMSGLTFPSHFRSKLFKALDPTRQTIQNNGVRLPC